MVECRQRLLGRASLASDVRTRFREILPCLSHHVSRAAQLIALDDPTLSVVACHDAARQAISAHLRALGYRVTSQAGAHRLVIEYAQAALADVVDHDDLVALDELRRDRHTAEYGEFASRAIAPERADSAISLATRVVDAVARALSRKNR
ncbi:MAG: HEPN domain-containing protein [Acidimicrobiales bacterium]